MRWRGIYRTDEGKAVSRQPRDESQPTRRGVLLGAAGLASLGGVLAGCSTAAVPYGANEAGEVPQDGPAASAMAMAPSAMAPSPRATRADTVPNGSAPAKERGRATVRGTVLGAAREIPVGGGTIFTAARVVVTQPARGQYRAFSAVCTHVGCVLNQVTGGTINCPCHGSRFTITNGAVVAGPAPAPLPKKPVRIADGMIVIT
jgi:Rieske Fe-S protein